MHPVSYTTYVKSRKYIVIICRHTILIFNALCLTSCFSSLRNLSLLSSTTTKEHVPSGRLNKPKSHVSEISVIHVRVVAAAVGVDGVVVMVSSNVERKRFSRRRSRHR